MWGRRTAGRSMHRTYCAVLYCTCSLKLSRPLHCSWLATSQLRNFSNLQHRTLVKSVVTRLQIIMTPFYQNHQYFLIFLFYVIAVVSASLTEESPTYLWHQRRSLENTPIAKRHNVSSYDILQAEKLVAEAVAQQAKYNTYRVANPRRNTYLSRPSDESTSTKKKREDEPVQPTLNGTVLAAAALLSERNAAEQLANGTLYKPYTQFTALPRPLVIPSKSKRQTSSYWVSQVSDNGLPPMGWNPSYPV